MFFMESDFQITNHLAKNMKLQVKKILCTVLAHFTLKMSRVAGYLDLKFINFSFFGGFLGFHAKRDKLIN